MSVQDVVLTEEAFPTKPSKEHSPRYYDRSSKEHEITSLTEQRTLRPDRPNYACQTGSRLLEEQDCASWFHVQLGAGSQIFVKEKGGCAKSSRSRELGGGTARSHRDLTIPIRLGPACWRRSLQHCRENAGQLVPRAIGDRFTERCEREGRLCQILTEEQIERRDCKIYRRT